MRRKSLVLTIGLALLVLASCLLCYRVDVVTCKQTQSSSTIFLCTYREVAPNDYLVATASRLAENSAQSHEYRAHNVCFDTTDAIGDALYANRLEPLEVQGDYLATCDQAIYYIAPLIDDAPKQAIKDPA